MRTNVECLNEIRIDFCSFKKFACFVNFNYELRMQYRNIVHSKQLTSSMTVERTDVGLLYNLITDLNLKSYLASNSNET